MPGAQDITIESIESSNVLTLVQLFSSILAIFLIVTFVVSPAFATAGRAPPQSCDTLSANPNDAQAVSDGIQTSIFLAVSKGYKTAAIAACQQALEQYPDEARFQYQYGRMLLQRDPVSAMEWISRAAHQEYLIAQYTVGKFLRRDKNYAAGD